MKSAYILIILAIFVVSMSTLSFADFNIGVSPGTINLGNVTLDSTKPVDFFITTPSNETLLVKLNPIKGDLNFFDKAAYSGLIENHSEEDVTGWVKVIKNPVEIRPDNDTLKTTGGIINGKAQISFLLDIPNNAEPGYHVFYMEPVPSTTSEDIGSVGSRVVAVTAMGVIFNVPGDAIRKGVILDTETGSSSNGRLEIKTYFQNTGTVTVSAKAIQRIYNGTEMIRELSTGMLYVKPREIRLFTNFLDIQNISLGSYNTYTIVNYTTGRAEKSSEITITEASKTPSVSGQESSLLLPILIVAIILILSAIFYRRLR